MLPAGLNESLEVYKDGDNCFVLLNGNRFSYLEMPIQLREPFQAELIADRKALQFLREEFKIHDADLIEKQFVMCRYGRLDETPDLHNNIPVADAPACECAGDCKGFGIICIAPQVINGHISHTEYKVICLVSKGKQDIEIADVLHIEISTVRTFLARIREKLCVNNRIEIALWAYKKGI